MEEKKEVYVLQPRSSIEKLHTAMVTEFERVWNVTKVGSLHCTKESRAAASAWFNEFRLMVSLITSVDLEELVFEDPTGNEEAARRNRLKMLYYYSISYTAYVRFCQLLKRERASKFSSDVSQCVEDDVD